MGSEEGEDTQKLKRIAAAAYDYDNDSRWADYWSNILIPPHLASRNDVVDHYNRKFYQRYIVRFLFLGKVLLGFNYFPPIQPLLIILNTNQDFGNFRPFSNCFIC